MTDQQTDKEAAIEEVREYRRQCNGSVDQHRHFLGILYTDGIKLVADKLEAHWLIDLVASWQPSIKKRHPERWGFQVWRLETVYRQTSDPSVKGMGWKISAWDDTPGESTRLATQAIEYSDFPEALSPFEFWVEGDVMMLKEEH